MLLLGKEVFYMGMEGVDIRIIIDLFVYQRDQVFQGTQSGRVFCIIPCGQGLLKDRYCRRADKISELILQNM